MQDQQHPAFENLSFALFQTLQLSWTDKSFKNEEYYLKQILLKPWTFSPRYIQPYAGMIFRQDYRYKQMLWQICVSLNGRYVP